MQKPILALMLLFLAVSGYSQYSLKVSNVRPTGKFGASQKATVGAELCYKTIDDEDESGFSFRFSLGYARFKSRLDTFPTYGTITSQGTTVTAGYTVIHKFNLTSLGMGADYNILVGEKLQLYPGVDAGVLFSGLEYDSYTPMISDEGYSGGYVYLSFRLRAGAEYRINEMIGVFAEATRSMNFSPDAGGLAYNDYGLGIRIRL